MTTKQVAEKGKDWKTVGHPCKKGWFCLMCNECANYINGDDIIGHAGAFVTCERCGHHSWIIFTAPRTIHDTCRYCDEDCKIVDETIEGIGEGEKVA